MQSCLKNAKVDHQAERLRSFTAPFSTALVFLPRVFSSTFYMLIDLISCLLEFSFELRYLTQPLSAS